MQGTSGNTSGVGKTGMNDEPNGSHKSDEWKIWAYSTAAPPFLARHCTVLDSDRRVLRKGTNGWTALAGNPKGPSNPDIGWKDPHEAAPIVADANGMKWLEGIMTGKKPKNEVDGWAWMLHGDVGSSNRTPRANEEQIAKDKADGQWIESGPHLMLLPSNPRNLDGQTTDFNSGAPYVMFAGTDYAHLMIPYEGYFDYQAKK